MYRLHCFIAVCARSGSISLDMCICRRMVAQGRQKHHPNWYTMIKTVRIFTGRPLAYPCASILRVPSSCLLWATDLLGDLCTTVVNMLKTSQTVTMARFERPVCHPWTTKAPIRPPLFLQRRPGQFCGRTRETQTSQPLCKGGVTKWAGGCAFISWCSSVTFGDAVSSPWPRTALRSGGMSSRPQSVKLTLIFDKLQSEAIRPRRWVFTVYGRLCYCVQISNCWCCPQKSSTHNGHIPRRTPNVN